MNQMCFSGTANCSSFQPNMFRKNICALCQNKIQDHFSAADQDISNAIEFVADNLPTLIWSLKNRGQEGRKCLYMGGFKSAVNLEFLINHDIGMIVCAAKDLAKTFGPKYQRLVEKRNQALPNIHYVQVDWIDHVNQAIDSKVLRNVILAIHQCQNSVLVHCAQGKSRSAVICIGYMASLRPTVAISDIVKEVKSKRNMAEPNHGFLLQLTELQRRNYFSEIVSEADDYLI